ncbi:dimethylmenaquinone methyltransferase [Peptoniphilus sp. ING2-D1G]|nr:dimethylmenaquinone methyltransferase [Peptoniphilus sp. ING2-D1G]
MELKKLFEIALTTDPAQIGHYVQGGYMDVSIKPIKDDLRVIGPAFTIRLPGNDNAMLYYAMEKAPKGSVIVIDRMGDKRIACCGEIVALSAKTLGMAGIVVDGPSTDTRAIREMDFPVFSTGRASVTNTFKGIDGEYNIPINCGGAVVNPGDIIYGDLDGVVVAPADRFEELVKKAKAADEVEKLWKENFEKGGTIADFINLEKLVSGEVGKSISEIMQIEK